MLAGPSSAGKTTTALRLKTALENLGVNTFTISLDDFYKNREDSPRLPDGTPDFETVNALDLPLLSKTLNTLMEKGAADIPVFDFVTGSRSDKINRIELGKSDVVVVEGLHALNPVITQTLPAQRLLKMYINVSSRIYDKDGDIILNKRNMRLIRRMTRDIRSRGSSFENTLSMWNTVGAGEDKYLFPFRDEADIKINTIILYESCVFRNIAIPMLGEISRSSVHYSDAQRLIRGLERFEPLSPEYVPENSLLREFLG
jgi:uridine kinase